MSDSRVIANLISFAIDPFIERLTQGVWTSVSGSPSYGSSKYTINNAELRTVSQFLYGEINMVMTIPTAPTAGHSRDFGFKGVSIGDRASVRFSIVDNKLLANVFDNDGNAIASQQIPWNAAWTNAAVNYIISYSSHGANFTVRTAAGAADEAKFSVDFGTKIINIPTFIDIDNNVADAMTISYVFLNNVHRRAGPYSLVNTAGSSVDVATFNKRCSLSKSANQAITTGADRTITWDTELIDTDAMHNNVTNNERITIVTAGDYLITATIKTDGNATLDIQLKKNAGATVIAAVKASNANPQGGTVTAMVTLAAGDYVFVTATTSLNDNVIALGSTFQALRVG